MKSLLPASLLVGLLLAPGFALAGAREDCQHGRGAQVRLRACTEVIDKLAVAPEEKAVASRARGLLRLDAGAVDDAIADFTRAIGLAPQDAQSYAGRARARVVRGDLPGAIEDFTHAIRLAPDHASFLLGRGHVYFVRGEAQKAIEDFSAVIRLNPKSASAYNQRGLAYRRLGDIDRAIGDYTSAIDLNPVYALAYNNRGYAYEAQGRKPEAIADFKAALLLDASLVGARDGLARLGAAGAAQAETEQRIRDGRQIVTTYCAGCHAVGATGESVNPRAPAFRTLRGRHPGLSLREPLSRGIAAPHDVMPKFALTPAQVDTVIAYINSLSRPERSAKSKGWSVQISDAQDIGDVRRGAAYAKRVCAECHNIAGSATASPKPKAPTFRQIANTPGITVTSLTVWSRSTHATMPNLVISPDDMDDLIAYILSLKTKP